MAIIIINILCHEKIINLVYHISPFLAYLLILFFVIEDTDNVTDYGSIQCGYINDMAAFYYISNKVSMKMPTTMDM